MHAWVREGEKNNNNKKKKNNNNNKNSKSNNKSNNKSKNKRWHCPRHELTLLTLAFPSPALLADAPPSVLENVVAQFAKILPSDAKARKQFVTSGGLKKVGPTISASASRSQSERVRE